MPNPTTIELANTVLTPGTDIGAPDYQNRMQRGIQHADIYDTIISSTKALDGSTKEPLPGADVVYDGAGLAADMQAALNEGGIIWIDGLIDGFTNQFTLPDGAMVYMPFAALRAAGDDGTAAYANQRILGFDINKCKTRGMDSGWLALSLASGITGSAACRLVDDEKRLFIDVNLLGSVDIFIQGSSVPAFMRPSNRLVFPVSLDASGVWGSAHVQIFHTNGQIVQRLPSISSMHSIFTELRYTI